VWLKQPRFGTWDQTKKYLTTMTNEEKQDHYHPTTKQISRQHTIDDEQEEKTSVYQKIK
jgi:hypothetical protein